MAGSTEMKVEIIAKETIKPSSPTPTHLRTLNLSLLDQFLGPSYLQVLLFYTSKCSATSNGDGGDGLGNGGCQEKSNEIIRSQSHRLKQSLSEILTLFYPFAGRIEEHPTVNCNDYGAHYLEARVNCSLMDVLEEPKSEKLKHFAPTDLTMSSTGSNPLLIVQATFFDCESLALGISLSHLIADATTVDAFITAWASTALRHHDAVAVPDFTAAASLFPPIHHFVFHVLTPTTKNCIAKRFVFDASKITALKAKASTTTVEQPTRFVAVSALLWKCAVAASRSRLGSKRPSILLWAVNLRPRLVPPLSENSIGNIVVPHFFQAKGNEFETELPELVRCLRKNFAESLDQFLKKVNQGDDQSCQAILDLYAEYMTALIEAAEADLYVHSSSCRLRLYEADFGWGTPAWVRVSDISCVPNIVTMMDTRDGEGIEAWVSLVEEDMALFEHDPELLPFVYVNPSPLRQPEKYCSQTPLEIQSS